MNQFGSEAGERCTGSAQQQHKAGVLDNLSGSTCSKPDLDRAISQPHHIFWRPPNFLLLPCSPKRNTLSLIVLTIAPLCFSSVHVTFVLFQVPNIIGLAWMQHHLLGTYTLIIIKINWTNIERQVRLSLVTQLKNLACGDKHTRPYLCHFHQFSLFFLVLWA